MSLETQLEASKQKRAFSRRFHLIAHEAMFPNNHDYFCFPFFDEQIVITRIDGRLKCFSNACPHRGLALYPLGVGNQKPICGYHGLNFQKNPYRLVAITGWLFFSLNDYSVEPRRIVDTPRINGVKRFSSELINARWELCIENALDDTHIKTVHKNTFDKLVLSTGRYQFFPDGSMWKSVIQNPAIEKLVKTFGESSGAVYNHHHFFPFAAISRINDLFFSLQLYLPHGEKTYFVNVLLRRDMKDLNPFYNAFLRSTIAMNRRVFREDAEICEQVLKYDPAAMLLSGEGRIKQFRKLMALELQGSSPREMVEVLAEIRSFADALGQQKMQNEEQT